MNLNVTLFESIESTIDITKENISTGRITEYPTTHNLLTQDFKRHFMQCRDTEVFPYSTGLKVGSGNSEPAASDTTLGSDNTSWYNTSSSPDLWGHFDLNKFDVLINSAHSVSLILYYTIPASEQCVGTITELGLHSTSTVYYKNNGNWTYTQTAHSLLTHSLLKDAEGHPYTVSKTSLDQITVRYKVTFTNSSIDLIRFLVFMRAQFIQDGDDRYTEKIVCRGFATYTSYTPNSYNKAGVAPCRKLSQFKILDNYIYTSIRPSNSTPGSSLQTIAGSQDIYNTYDGSSVAPTGVPTSALCDDQGHYTIPARRVSAKWSGNGHYILGFLFYGYNQTRGLFHVAKFLKAGLGYNDISLTDYSIGTGDGTTSSFKPPFNYWKENTEKIYIDGVEQIRGVDYVCDPHNNLDNLGEFLPLYHATIIDADWITFGYSSSAPGDMPTHASEFQAGVLYHLDYSSTDFKIHENYYGIFVCPRLECGHYDATTKRYYEIDYRTCAYKFNKNLTGPNLYSVKNYLGVLSSAKPMIFALPIDEFPDFPWAVDTVYLWYSSSSSAVTFSVSYSDDNATWTKIVDHMTGYKSGRSNQGIKPQESSLSEWCEYAIGSLITKKYWKLELHYNPATTPTSAVFESTQIGFTIKHKGSNIVFTNPPANGSIITMDASSDLLYKDEDHVIDCGITLSM